MRAWLNCFGLLEPKDDDDTYGVNWEMRGRLNGCEPRTSFIKSPNQPPVPSSAASTGGCGR
jgi:hypothetical protein